MDASALGSSIPALLEARKSDSISLSLSATHPKCRRCQIAVLGLLLLAGPVVMGLLRLQPLRPGFHFHWQRQGSTRKGWGGREGAFCEAIGNWAVCLRLLFCYQERVGERGRGEKEIEGGRKNITDLGRILHRFIYESSKKLESKTCLAVTKKRAWCSTFNPTLSARL